jgi:UDP-N-acetylmuramoylalanine--D-glutamate ligase
MKPRPPLPAGPYLIVGLARSGVAAALALTERGEQVTGVDGGRPDIERLTAAGVPVHLESDGVALLRGVGCVIKSPGVPARAPVVEAARRQGVPVIGELELAWRMLPNEFIAVTGTNGKTTTVELVGHIHREAVVPVAVAGNVGTALSGLAGHVGPEVTVVCEASSFQLEDTSEFSPEAAVLLNLTPDHLDRHGTMESYRSAKLQAFTRQGNDDVAVAPLVLPGVIDLGGCARRVLFGHDAGAAMSERAGELWWEEQPLVAVAELPLRGAHNVDNAMAAAAVCLARGIAADAVRSGLRSFAGVAHRLEEVARRDGVLFVNDSKATNVESTLVALASFAAGSVHLIAGGQSKGQSFAPLRDAVAAACQAVYLIGQDADAIAASLHSAGVTLHRCGDLDHAVVAAAAAAREGEVVLLSPACASYDQFADFEDRGERFRELASRSALRT